MTPIWNVMAAIPGHVRDEVIIIGCHRDGVYYLTSYVITHLSS